MSVMRHLAIATVVTIGSLWCQEDNGLFDRLASADVSESQVIQITVDQALTSKIAVDAERIKGLLLGGKIRDRRIKTYLAQFLLSNVGGKLTNAETLTLVGALANEKAIYDPRDVYFLVRYIAEVIPAAVDAEVVAKKASECGWRIPGAYIREIVAGTKERPGKALLPRSIPPIPNGYGFALAITPPDDIKVGMPDIPAAGDIVQSAVSIYMNKGWLGERLAPRDIEIILADRKTPQELRAAAAWRFLIEQMKVATMKSFNAMKDAEKVGTATVDLSKTTNQTIAMPLTLRLAAPFMNEGRGRDMRFYFCGTAYYWSTFAKVTGKPQKETWPEFVVVAKRCGWDINDAIEAELSSRTALLLGKD